jgi:D-beta-D-heptose 7-phosphate kinase/D-beta-D-heptose 1-phosphate adenosyltransferase
MPLPGAARLPGFPRRPGVAGGSRGSLVKLDCDRLEGLLEEFRRVRLLVLGDLVLDEYVWGEVERVSPEAPVPVVHVRDETVVLGGAGNVARNVVALGGSVAFCSVVGDDAAGRRARDLLKNLGVDAAGLVADPGRPTTRKTRVIARGQQVVRFDRESLEPPPAGVGRRLLGAVDEALPGCDGVVVADYDKGVLSSRTGRQAMRRFLERRIPVVVDPKAALAPYRGASLVKPNLREAETLSGIAIHGPEGLARAAARLRRQLGGGDVVVTRGGEGMTLFEGEGPGLEVQTAAREVFDVQGAGDTTIAALALAQRVGATLLEAAVVANAAAGVVVGKVGTATADPEEVRKLLPAAIAAARGAA